MGFLRFGMHIGMVIIGILVGGLAVGVRLVIIKSEPFDFWIGPVCCESGVDCSVWNGDWGDGRLEEDTGVERRAYI